MASRTSAVGLSPPYVKLLLQRLQHPAERRIDRPLRERLRRMAERAPPRHTARAVRQPLPTVLIQHIQSLEQLPALATQHGLDCRRRDAAWNHQRDIANDRRLHGQRLIPRHARRLDCYPDLQSEQRTCPAWRIGIERQSVTDRLLAALHHGHPTGPIGGWLHVAQRCRY